MATELAARPLRLPNTEQSQHSVTVTSRLPSGRSHPGVRQGGRAHAGGGERAVLRVLGADGQRQVRAEGIGHRMEGLHRRQAAAVQVVPHLHAQWAIKRTSHMARSLLYEN